MDAGDITESGGLDTENVADILEEFNDVEGEVQDTSNAPDPALAYLYSHHPETILELRN
jgi:hypothetical protein